MFWKQLIPIHGNILQRRLQLSIRNISVAKTLSKDHYEALGLKKGATQAEIKNAYFELTKIYHPDRIEATDENLARFREISNAYEVLGNEQSRKLYDRGLIDVSDSFMHEPEDPKDPIIKFYKQKQQSSKIFSQAQELDEWTQSFYEKARTEGLKKNDFFQKTTNVKDDAPQGLQQNIFLIAACIVLNIILATNESESTVGKFYNKYLNFGGDN